MVKRHRGTDSELLGKIIHEFEHDGAPKAAHHVAETTPPSPPAGQTPHEAHQLPPAVGSPPQHVAFGIFRPLKYSSMSSEGLPAARHCPVQDEFGEEDAGEPATNGGAALPSLLEAKVMPGIPTEAQEQRVSNAIQSLLVAACLGDPLCNIPVRQQKSVVWHARQGA